MESSYWLFGLLWLFGEIYFIRLSNWSFWFILLQTLYVLGFALLNVAIVLVTRRKFRCPECGGAVEDTGNGIEGDPALKLCKHCDIIWRIGTI